MDSSTENALLEHISNMIHQERDRESASKLVETSKRMFHDPIFPDLIVKCGTEEFKYHRGILCQRNQFFKACCVHGFKETTTCTIDLPDDNPAAVRILLEYIYTFQMPEWLETLQAFHGQLAAVVDLAIVADKYALQDLKEHVCIHLSAVFRESVEGLASGRSPKVELTSENHEEDEMLVLIVKVFGDDCAGLEVLRESILDELVSCDGFIRGIRVRETIDRLPALRTPLLNKLATHLQESWDLLQDTHSELSDTREDLKRKRSDLEDKERKLQKRLFDFSDETLRVHRLMKQLRDHGKALPANDRRALGSEQMVRKWNQWRNRNRT